jgi:hypothetical protein
MRFRRLMLSLAAAGAAQAAAAQQAVPSVATPERDLAAVSIASGSFIVLRLGEHCLDVVGRPETPQKLVAAWQGRNARYVEASARYLDVRLQEAETAGGKERRDAGLAEFRRVVRDAGEAALRNMLQGRKEDACMRAITLLDAGALDITSKQPKFEQLEALARWAER